MSRLLRPPRALRRPGVTLDNISIVPASLLPYKARYQALANQLPRGDVLIVLPTEDTAEKRILESAAARFEAKGHRVTTIPITAVS
jgi:hypothetical protein